MSDHIIDTLLHSPIGQPHHCAIKLLDHRSPDHQTNRSPDHQTTDQQTTRPQINRPPYPHVIEPPECRTTELLNYSRGIVTPLITQPSSAVFFVCGAPQCGDGYIDRRVRRTACSQGRCAENISRPPLLITALFLEKIRSDGLLANY